MRTVQPAKFIQLFTLLFTIMGILPASAQQFTWQAALPAIHETGFYNVILRPEFIAKSHDTALTDIRLFEKEVAVGYIRRHDSQYVVLPAPVITTKNDAAGRRTIIHLQFNDEYLVQQFRLRVASPAYYKRRLLITTDSTLQGHLEEFMLVSEQPASFSLQVHMPKKLQQCFIIIQNDDNPALEIRDITALQQHIFLTAWLEKGKDYLLKTGVPDLPAPVYDLPYFANKLPGKIPEMATGNITAIPAVIKNVPSEVTETRPAIFKSKGWIWGGIISIILLISLLTMRLLRDMRERK